jgi:hypothetical protein
MVDDRERLQLVGLVGSVGALLLLAQVVGVLWMPPGLLALPLVLGGLLLRLRAMLVLLVVVLAALLVQIFSLDTKDFRPGNLILISVLSVLAVRLSLNREELGLPGLRSEGMLIELRERLLHQGELPSLPPLWRAEVVQSSAGGGSFGGDFLVSCLTESGRRLELALVDVSGKGVDAGTRSLQLAGAFGGLLGAVPPERFLESANEYVLRQEWEEGFATAVHVAVDLTTGDYLLESAGHPPAAQFRAGSGQWQLSRAAGAVLGFFPQMRWTGERGRLGPGDALLLYTDGCIEMPGRDLAMGVDQMLGEANRLVVTTFDGGAGRLIDAVSPDGSDDRALVLLWRA